MIRKNAERCYRITTRHFSLSLVDRRSISDDFLYV